MKQLTAALKTALSETKDEITRVQRQRQQLVERLERLQAEQRGLELAISRHGGEELVHPNGWGHYNRSQAVQRVLELAGNALTPKEITQQLQSTGRDDKYPLVSAALAYLKRQGVAQQSGYGRWELAPDHRSGAVIGEEEE